jgi:hypothetical protein
LPTSGPRTSDAPARAPEDAGLSALVCGDSPRTPGRPLAGRLRLRLDLEPWRDTQAITDLDELLAAFGEAR